MGAFGFLGGFGSAATRGAGDQQRGPLERALELYKLRQEMEMDPLRRAYMLSRINKPASMGTGVKTTENNQPGIFYPQANKFVPLPTGSQFYQSPSSASPITKSFQQYLDSKSLTREQYLKLDPAKKDALYREYRSSLSPDLQLKDAVLEARLQQIKQSMGLTSMEIPFVMDMIKGESTAGAPAPSDIVPAAPVVDGSDPTTWGVD